MTAEEALSSLANQKTDNVPDEVNPLVSVVLIPGEASALELMDVLVALDAQTDTDFELIIVVMPSPLEEGRGELLALFSSGLSDRSRIVQGPQTNKGRLAAVLSAGVTAAKGEYVTFLDGQSIVFANFIETFARLAAERPGAALRARALIQPMHELQWPDGRVGFEPIAGAQHAAEAQKNSPLEQLAPLQSPLGSYAVTRRYFENDFVNLEASELLPEAVMHCGLCDAGNEVILLVRRFGEVQVPEPNKARNIDQSGPTKSDRSSSTPPESPIGMNDECPTRLENSTEDRLSGALVELTAARQELDATKVELANLRESKSWRITAPIRWLSHSLRGDSARPR